MSLHFHDIELVTKSEKLFRYTQNFPKLVTYAIKVQLIGYTMRLAIYQFKKTHKGRYLWHVDKYGKIEKYLEFLFDVIVRVGRVSSRFGEHSIVIDRNLDPPISQVFISSHLGLLLQGLTNIGAVHFQFAESVD